jgi:hypothetical protein
MILRNSEYKLNQEKETLFDLKSEVINVVRGTSAFGSVLLTQLINKSESLVAEYKENLLKQNIELQNNKNAIQSFAINYEKLTKSLSSFHELTLSEKQQALRICIRKIYINKKYDFKYEWAF